MDRTLSQDERNDIAEATSSISSASSYAGIGEYWDTHDLADHWDQTREVDFELRIESPSK